MLGCVIPALLGCGSANPQAGPSGTVTVTITGLGPAIASGGSVTVTPGSGPPIVLSLPVSGVASSVVPAGTYHVVYTPPAGHTLAQGESGDRDVQVVADQTTQVGFVVVPPSSIQAPNEPPGFVAVADRPLSAINEPGWVDAGPDLSIQGDPLAPRSPPNVGQARFPAGFSAGSPVTATLALPTGPRSVYVSFWFRLSSGWEAPSTQLTRLLRLATPGGAPPLEVLIAARGAGAGPYEPVVRPVNDPAGVGTLAANVPPPPGPLIVAGTWNRWELVLTLNSAANVADGEVRWWLNGVLAGQHTGIAFAGLGQGLGWSDLEWRPTWTGTDPVGVDQLMRIDHIYVSRQ